MTSYLWRNSELWKVQWFWQDGTVPAYTAWAPELPNPGYGQCSFFLGSTISNGKWYQDKCQGKYKYYICQKEREGYPPKPPPTKPPHPDGCPGSESDGWVINSENPQSDYCYKFYTNDKTSEVNWKSAQARISIFIPSVVYVCPLLYLRFLGSRRWNWKFRGKAEYRNSVTFKL